jgi:hypothetical protein
MITDDRLIFNSLANWEFGPDNVGNLMDRRSLKASTNFMEWSRGV